MKWGKFLLLLMIFISLLGCNAINDKASYQVELVVSAASSLNEALLDIKESFEEKNKDITITYSFGGSGKLAQQIVHGAPVDIFLSASEDFIKPLRENNLIINDSLVLFASNDLVLVTKKNSNQSIKSFEQLKNVTTQQIAIGNPVSVPAGKYAKEILLHLDLWGNLEEKLIYTKDVRQVLTYVESGNVEFGIIYKSDTFVSDEVEILAVANSKWHTPITYPGVILKDSSHPNESKRFMEFLKNEGKDILVKRGFN